MTNWHSCRTINFPEKINIPVNKKVGQYQNRITLFFVVQTCEQGIVGRNASVK